MTVVAIGAPLSVLFAFLCWVHRFNDRAEIEEIRKAVLQRKSSV